MKIAVLSRKSSLYSTRRIVEELKERSIKSVVYNPLKFDILVGEGVQNIYYNRRRFQKFQAVIPRIGTTITRYGTAVLRQLIHMGIPSTCSPLGVNISKDKFRTLQVLSKKGINVPRTVLLRNPDNLKNAIDSVGGVPIIAKLIRGTQGIGVIYLDSPQAALSTLETLWGMGKQILIQEFIIESKGTDIRCIVVDGKVIAAYKRIAKIGEFRSNIHKGAVGEKIEITSKMEKVAVKCAKSLDLGVAGIDILESVDGFKVIEVNSSPGLQGVENVTGINVAGHIVDFSIKLAGN